MVAQYPVVLQTVTHDEIFGHGYTDAHDKTARFGNGCVGSPPRRKRAQGGLRLPSQRRSVLSAVPDHSQAGNSAFAQPQLSDMHRAALLSSDTVILRYDWPVPTELAVRM